VVVAPTVVVGGAVVCSVVVATRDVVASVVVVITTLSPHNDNHSLWYSVINVAVKFESRRVESSMLYLNSIPSSALN